MFSLVLPDQFANLFWNLSVHYHWSRTKICLRPTANQSNGKISGGKYTIPFCFFYTGAMVEPSSPYQRQPFTKTLETHLAKVHRWTSLNQWSGVTTSSRPITYNDFFTAEPEWGAEEISSVHDFNCLVLQPHWQFLRATLNLICTDAVSQSDMKWLITYLLLLFFLCHIFD